MLTEAKLREGRTALVAGDWDAARACFEAAGEIPEAVDGLSQAAHFSGDYARGIELKERAFAMYREAGRLPEAADTARWLGFLNGLARRQHGRRQRLDRAGAGAAGGGRRVPDARLAGAGHRTVHARDPGA